MGPITSNQAIRNRQASSIRFLLSYIQTVSPSTSIQAGKYIMDRSILGIGNDRRRMQTLSTDQKLFGAFATSQVRLVRGKAFLLLVDSPSGKDCF